MVILFLMIVLLLIGMLFPVELRTTYGINFLVIVLLIVLLLQTVIGGTHFGFLQICPS